MGGAIVLALDSSLVSKSGNRVRRTEEVAMRLVKQYTDIPIPDIISRRTIPMGAL